MKKIIYIIIIFLILGGGLFYFWKKDSFVSGRVESNKSENKPVEKKIKKDRVELIPITDGSSYGELVASSSVGAIVGNEIYKASLDICDLAKIRSGHNLEFVFDGETDKFKEFIYKINSEEEVVVKKMVEKNATSTPETAWQAEIKDIPYEIKIVTKEGEVETSMYEAALKNNIDIRAIIELANAFQWSIDFAMDPRKGDTFKFVYEERYLDGEYEMPGKVLAGYYVNNGTKYQVYYFEENEENVGYFDENGNSVQKMFLKAPVEFRYISSGYTTGNRVVMEVGLSGSHRAIDYAASYGTPIRAVGDGTVILAAWNGGYGNMVKIRHNGTYQTNYGHMSKFAVKRGNKVKQGDIIGYVGSTGYSTGPHVHFEMVKNGAKINPLNEVLPPGKPIKEENQARFFNEIKKWQGMLGE